MRISYLDCHTETPVTDAIVHRERVIAHAVERVQAAPPRDDVEELARRLEAETDRARRELRRAVHHGGPPDAAA